MPEGAELADVLWLGGMSGVGKTTAARRIARRHDLRLYSVDSYTYAHAERLPPEAPFFERVLDSTPDELADVFEESARRRFALVLDDLRALPNDAPVLVDGPQILPELVEPLLADRGRATFVTAAPDLQREILAGRGLGGAALTPDPETAHARRLARDALLADRVREAARRLGLHCVQITAVAETEPAVEGRFLPFLEEWLARDDRGDVAARRRDENDVRLRQWRSHAGVVPEAAEARLGLACECDRAGCGELVEIGLGEAEAARERGEPLLAHA